MEDFRACSEVCRAHGFVRQAGLFRSFAEDRGVVYVLVECKDGFELGYESREGGEPCLIFFDRAEADLEAERRNIKAFREVDILESCYIPQLDRIDIDEITEYTADQLSESIGEILGQEYRFPENRNIFPRPVFPPSATDDQMLKIMALFSRRWRYFYVTETTLVL